MNRTRQVYVAVGQSDVQGGVLGVQGGVLGVQSAYTPTVTCGVMEVALIRPYHVRKVRGKLGRSGTNGHWCNTTALTISATGPALLFLRSRLRQKSRCSTQRHPS
jgi:hypothetical protein